MAETAEQFVLPGMPAETSVSDDLAVWTDRMEVFQKIAKDRGGLLPQSVVPDVLAVSRARVSELVTSGRLERVNFLGTSFITGRSIKAHKLDEKAKGGRGVKRVGFWKSLTIGAKFGASLGCTIASEQ